MSVRAWRFATLMFAALSLTMESAHVLELPQKLQYDAVMYAAVNTTLYRGFAIVGAIYQVGSIIMALVLTILLRKRHPSFGWTLAGALLLAVALVVWATVVQPVNVQVANAVRDEPGSVPALWMQLRLRWEGGHAAGFVLQVVGFACLLGSVLVETPPDDEPRARPVGAW
jgi:drug/metabolite transporter (DMT)-like permease